MAKIFITGSSDGLGALAAIALIKQGHQVVLHARNEKRAKDTKAQIPGAKDLLIGDLSDMEETKNLATDVNALGRFDAIIQNAGVYRAPGDVIFKVNTLAPYILTSLIAKPKRIIYLSSGDHRGGNPHNLDKVFEQENARYSDSKLHNVILSMAVARKWPDVYSNALDPGWVPTKMGGAGAPDDLQKGYETQVWLAVSNESEAKVSGQYFYHKQKHRFVKEAADPKFQDKFLALCEKASGIAFPTN